MKVFNFKIVLVVLTLILVLFMVGIVNAQEKVVLEFAHMLPAQHVFHETLLRVDEKLQTVTDGRISLKIYPNGTYGGQLNTTDAVRMGSLDMTEFSVFVDYYKPISVLYGPYLFRSYDHWSKFLKSDICSELEEAQADAAGVKCIGIYTSGFRNLLSKKAGTTPEEFKGMKMRVVDQPPYPEAATVLNTIGTPMSISEVYMALKTGVVDATENPLVQLYSTKFYEVAKNLILTEHMIAVSQVIMSLDKWNSLTVKDQELIQSAFDEALVWNLEQIKTKKEEFIKLMQEQGVEVIRPDKDPFMERIKLVYENYPEWEEYYKKIQAIE